MYCDQCGMRVSDDAQFCDRCGARQDAAPPTVRRQGQTETVLVVQPSAAVTASGPTLKVDAEPSMVDAVKSFLAAQAPSRIGGAIILVVSLVWCFVSGTPVEWLFLLAPVLVGGLFPVLRSERLTSPTDGWEARFASRHARATARTGAFSKYFSRPLWRGSALLWGKTTFIGDPHVRAGVRVGLLLYFVGFMVGLLIFVGYVLLVIVIAIIVIAVLLWILTEASSERSGGRTSRTIGDFYGIGRRVSQSRSGTTFWGHPKIDHYDEDGRKVGESRPGETWLGEPKTEHYDREGRKVGESRPDETWLGEPKSEHYDREGREVGESRPGETWLGEPKTEHYDREGRKIGESRPGETLWGDPQTDHYDEPK